MRGRALGSIAALGLLAGLASVGFIPAADASAATCPTVAANGLVTPGPSAGVDWSGCDLTGAVLRSGDLEGANLSDATLANADLTAADLTAATLSGANFSGADLTGATLSSATITNADFAGATLTNVQSGSIPGGPAGVVTLPANWMLVSGYLLGPGANLVGADLSNLIFNSGLDLAGASLYNADLSNSYFSTTDFDGADMTYANLTGTTLDPGASMAGTTLTYANLTDAQLAGANMTGDPLTNATLTGTNWGGANLTSADLAGDNLSSGIGGNLTDANLTNTTVGSSVGGNLSGTNFSGATFKAGIASGGITGQPLNLPSDWILSGGFLLGPGAEFSGANLTGVDMSGADLSNAILYSATVTGADMSGTNLTGATMTLIASGGVTGTPAALPSGWSLAAGYLFGPEAATAGADLAGANLTNVNLAADSLQDANLTNADLNGATLTGVNMLGATMTGVQSGNLTTEPYQLPVNWFESDGYLLGPGADLNGATVTGINGQNDDLAGASFVGSELTGDILTEADVAGANFTDANLTGVNFQGVADADDLNLTGANLIGANLTGVSFTGATWSDTTCPDGTSSAADGGTCISHESYQPTARPVATGSRGASGWYTSPVTVTWNWTSPGSTLSSILCHPTGTSSGTGGAVTITGVCTNNWDYAGQASVVVKIDTTRPVVTLAGPHSGGVYAAGKVPAASCRTTDSVSGVSKNATLKISTTGKNGVGSFTATCAGATSVAGSTQAQPVSVRYTVDYGFAGFVAPAASSTVARSGKTVSVRFRLAAAKGKSITAALGRQLAGEHEITVALAGPKIKVTTASCSWSAAGAEFTCTVKIPAGVVTGQKTSYTITAREDLAGLTTAPPVGRAKNPEVVHFR